MTDDIDLYEGCPEPTFVIKGNKVMCNYCGLKLATRSKYVNHFKRRHLNEDGTWRPADHKFRLQDPTPDEQEAINWDIDGERRRKKAQKGFFDL